MHRSPTQSPGGPECGDDPDHHERRPRLLYNAMDRSTAVFGGHGGRDLERREGLGPAEGGA